MIMEKNEATYDAFIKEALAAYFTDPQIDFLERWLYDQLPTPPIKESL